MSAHLTTFIESEPLSLAELARAVGVEETWVVQLLQFEILRIEGPAAVPSQLRFGSSALRRAREVRRLEQDLGANLDAAALILELQDELHRLQGVLAAYRLD
jgi:chaperone modulatory protein CbpM